MINDVDTSVIFHFDYLLKLPNQLTTLLPEAKKWQDVVMVFDEDHHGEEIWFHAEVTHKNVLCWHRAKA